MGNEQEDRVGAAGDMLPRLSEREPQPPSERHLLAWVVSSRGNPLAGRQLLEDAGVTWRTGPSPDTEPAVALVAAGDAAAAINPLGETLLHHGPDARRAGCCPT